MPEMSVTNITGHASMRVTIQESGNRGACLPAAAHARQHKDAGVFVPEGPDDRSQAIYCLGSRSKRDPSRRDGVIGSHPHRPFRDLVREPIIASTYYSEKKAIFHKLLETGLVGASFTTPGDARRASLPELWV
jgi:hypothetical protein